MDDQDQFSTQDNFLNHVLMNLLLSGRIAKARSESNAAEATRMAQGMRARAQGDTRNRLNALAPVSDPNAALNALVREDLMPHRNIMRVPAQPLGNIGIHAWPFPGARMPNVYRGPLTQPGVPGVQDAPERYVPGFEDQLLRGT